MRLRPQESVAKKVVLTGPITFERLEDIRPRRFSPTDIQSQNLERIFAILKQLAHRMSFPTREI